MDEAQDVLMSSDDPACEDGTAWSVRFLITWFHEATDKYFYILNIM